MHPLLDVLVPRFITEDVALIDVGDYYRPVCSLADVDPDEEFDAVVTMRSFTWLGFCVFPRQVGDPRPWPGSE